MYQHTFPCTHTGEITVISHQWTACGGKMVEVQIMVITDSHCELGC